MMTERFVLDCPGPTVPLAEQIRHGNYNYANPDITDANFSLTIPAGKREVVLYDPRGYVSSETMIARMKADGCRPATFDDALAMGIQYPDRQRQNPIVFLGTAWRDPGGDRRVPVLGVWDGSRALSLYCFGERGLGLIWFDAGWSGLCRFAVVRVS